MPDDKSNIPPTEATAFESRLSDGQQRFLAHAIEHAFAIGRRTPEDFVRHFPPATIMKGMADKPQLRANILVHTTGLKEKIACKKSWASAAEDLDIALKEGETDARAVVSVFHPDDRIRYLDAKALWAFVIEGDFWLAEAGKRAYGPAKEHIAFLLDQALKDGLITHRDVVDGISVSELATRLPKAELGKIIEGALLAGQKGAPFTESVLLGAMPPSVLVDYIPLTHLWDSVVTPRIAAAHGYIEAVGSGGARPEPANDAKDSKGGRAAATAEPPKSGPSTALAAGKASTVASAANAEADADVDDWVDAVEEDASLIADDELSDEDFA